MKANSKLWCVGALVLAMGFSPMLGTYYPALDGWLVVLLPVLFLLAIWLFNSALDHYIARHTRK